MFNAEIQDGHQKREINFCEKSPVDSADTLWVKNFVEIALSRSVSKINTFLRLTQKFKMAAKSGGKTIFQKVASRLCRHPEGQKFQKYFPGLLHTPAKNEENPSYCCKAITKRKYGSGESGGVASPIYKKCPSSYEHHTTSMVFSEYKHRLT